MSPCVRLGQTCGERDRDTQTSTHRATQTHRCRKTDCTRVRDRTQPATTSTSTSAGLLMPAACPALPVFPERPGKGSTGPHPKTTTLAPCVCTKSRKPELLKPWQLWHPLPLGKHPEPWYPSLPNQPKFSAGPARFGVKTQDSRLKTQGSVSLSLSLSFVHECLTCFPPVEVYM